MTVKETAAELRVSEWTVSAMTRDGRLPKVPGIRRIRIPRAAVVALMEGAHPESDGIESTHDHCERHDGR